MKTALQVIFFSLVLHSFAAQAEPAIIAPKADTSLLLDITQVTGAKYVAVGERGHILISDDKGGSWRQVEVPVDVNLTAIDFLDDTHGVAVGFDQTIILTVDAGETWTVSHQQVSNYQPALFGVQYVSKEHITAVGAYGLYLDTTDGGKSWNNRVVSSLSNVYGEFSHFYDMERLSEDTWYLAGEKYIAESNDEGEEFSKGLIAVTTDAGQTWTKVNSPYEGSFFGITVKDNDIYVYGLRGNLFHSIDKGQSWQRIRLGTESGLHDMLITDNGTLALVGTGGVLVKKSGTDLTVDKRKDLKGRAALVSIENEQFIIVGEGGVETYPPVKATQQ